MRTSGTICLAIAAVSLCATLAFSQEKKIQRSDLPAAVEKAVASQGEAGRHQLAAFLHDSHARTSNSIKARAMPEPDSLGG